MFVFAILNHVVVDALFDVLSDEIGEGEFGQLVHDI